MEELSAAIIGCGRMGAFTSAVMRRIAPPCWFPLSHAEAVRAEPRLRLAALSDLDPDALARAADAYGVELRHASPEALIDEVRPRLLCIATRTPGRAALIQRALDAGTRALHVEKPLCNTVVELDGLREALHATRAWLTYGTIRRFFPVYRRALAMAQSGELGRLREIRVNLGSGALYWSHPHSIDLALFAAGTRAVAGVQARLADVEPGRGAATVESDPRVVSATIEFDDGVVARIGQAHGSDLILSCEDGEVAVRNDGWSLEIRAARGDAVYPAVEPQARAPIDDAPCGTLAPVGQLVDCLLGDAAAAAANRRVRDDVLTGQRIAFAMVQSHWQRSALVGLDEIDPALEVRAASGGRHA